MKLSEDSALRRLGVSPLGAICFLYLNGMKMSFKGTHGFSSLRRLSAIFSNTASIFAITSEFAGRWGDAIGAWTLSVYNHGYTVPAASVWQENSRGSNQGFDFTLVELVRTINQALQRRSWGPLIPHLASMKHQR